MIKESIIKELLVGSDIPLPVNYKTKDKDNEKEKKDKNTKEENEQKDKENVKEVKKATSFSSEDVHGGKEATKDIKDSPSNADNGEKQKNEDTSKGGGQEKTKEKNNEGGGKETKDNSNNGGGNKDTKDKKGKGRSTNGEKIEELLNEVSPKPIPRISETKEELVKKALMIIKRILKTTVGSEQSEDSGNHYNKRILSSLIIKDRLYLFNQAKKNRTTKEISMFIDTSMSMSIYTESIKQMIKTLSKQGFIINLYGAGNGLWYEDATNDEYNVRRTLEVFEGANIPELCRVTIETAAKICNNSELSIIIADFDGLSDFVKLSLKCTKDKIPYFLSTEDRYDWDQPWLHSWVDINYSKYPLNRVFELL